jgi:hypothetical protein
MSAKRFCRSLSFVHSIAASFEIRRRSFPAAETKSRSGRSAIRGVASGNSTVHNISRFDNVHGMMFPYAGRRDQVDARQRRRRRCAHRRRRCSAGPIDVDRRVHADRSFVRLGHLCRCAGQTRGSSRGGHGDGNADQVRAYRGIGSDRACHQFAAKGSPSRRHLPGRGQWRRRDGPRDLRLCHWPADQRDHPARADRHSRLGAGRTAGHVHPCHRDRRAGAGQAGGFADAALRRGRSRDHGCALCGQDRDADPKRTGCHGHCPDARFRRQPCRIAGAACEFRSRAGSGGRRSSRRRGGPSSRRCPKTAGVHRLRPGDQDGRSIGNRFKGRRDPHCQRRLRHRRGAFRAITDRVREGSRARSAGFQGLGGLRLVPTPA